MDGRFEQYKSDRTAWAFTVKDVRADSTDYSPFFTRAEQFGCEIECKYKELDSKGKVHYHGIMLIPKGFFRKRLMQQGIHLKLDELYDRAGWMKYITKDQDKHVDVPQTSNSASDELIEDAIKLKIKKRLV